MPSNPSIPDDVVEIGSIEIKVFMGAQGRGTGYTVESLNPEEAIGHLTIVLDRMREDRALSWDDSEDYEEIPDECPNCGPDLFPEEDD